MKDPAHGSLAPTTKDGTLVDAAVEDTGLDTDPGNAGEGVVGTPAVGDGLGAGDDKTGENHPSGISTEDTVASAGSACGGGAEPKPGGDGAVELVAVQGEGKKLTGDMAAEAGDDSGDNAVEGKNVEEEKLGPEDDDGGRNTGENDSEDRDDASADAQLSAPTAADGADSAAENAAAPASAAASRDNATEAVDGGGGVAGGDGGGAMTDSAEARGGVLAAEVTDSEAESNESVDSADEDGNVDDEVSASSAVAGAEDFVVVSPPEPEPETTAPSTTTTATTVPPAVPVPPSPPRKAAPQASPFSGVSVAPLPPPPLPPVLKKPEIVPPSDPTATPLLLCLPADSLHTVASFLETSDWAKLSESSRGANRACREVFRRVRMHGFRCATEVITAWVRGEHADARELTGLYIKSGVPIYPLCLGHSYHTLIWRMGIESREMEQANGTGQEANANSSNANANTNSNTSSSNVSASASTVSADGSEAAGRPLLDRFYTERYEARQRDGYYVPTLTYLEEKCLYWKYRALDDDDDSELGRILSPERRHSLSNAVSLRPPRPPPPPGAMPANAPPLGAPRAAGVPGLPPELPPHQQGPGANGRFVGGVFHGGGVPPHHARFGGAAGGAHGLPGAAAAAAGAPHHPAPRRTMSTSHIPPFQHPPPAGLPLASSATSQPRHPKMVVRVHRHLVDRHLLGRPAVNDEGGAMESSPFSLSADFFHPHLTPACPPTHPAAVYPSEYASPYFSGGEGGMYGGAGHFGHAAAAAAAPSPLARYPTPGQFAPNVRMPVSAHLQPTHAAAGPPVGGDGAPPPIVPEFPALGVEQPVTGGGADGAGLAAGDPADDGLGGMLGFETPAGAARPPFPPSHLRPAQLQHAVSFGPGPELSGAALADYGWGGTGGGVGTPTGSEYSVVTDVTLEVYSSSSNGLPKPGDDHLQCEDGGGGVTSSLSAMAVSSSKLRTLRGRFLSYQRKLNSLLEHFDSSGFDECFLDLWDEFMPLTAGIHYYDKHTPVPRMSSLHRFLTNPCPKAVGIVQCEIERIKISGRKGKKGVGMKGRLFPTYEYRLFIRDRRHGGIESQTGPPGEVRRDTVMMTARNRGKSAGAAAAAAAAGVVGSPPTPGSTKRGVNNYFLYMPQEADVEQHFQSVNDPSIFSDTFSEDRPDRGPPKPYQRPPPVGGNRMEQLGRLQSNFIGTEFQIFRPCILKQRRASALASSSAMPYPSDSDDDVEDDALSTRSGQSGHSGVSGASSGRSGRRRSSSIPRTSTRRMPRRGSFGRLSSAARRSLSRTRYGRNRSDASSANPADAVDSVSTPSSHEREISSIGESRKSRRRSSWTSLTRSAKVTSRRVSAANSPGSAVVLEPVFGEEENGVITYTANLLGNRPRIMDVCVPTVDPDGMVSTEWRRQCEEIAEREGGNSQPDTMMSRFKQMQQRLENPPPPTAEGNNNNNGDGGNNQGDDPAVGEAGGDIDVDGEAGISTGANNNNLTSPDDYGLMALQNRPPWWNVELGAFVLNFGGRVSVASVKNFQLCDRNDQEHIMLQFGRIQGRHSFTMDFQYPLSAMQAFAIAISSLQSKISFG